MTLPPEWADRPVIRRLLEFDPQAVVAASEFRGELSLRLPPGRLRAVVEFLRADPELTFNYLADITAVDRYPGEPRFEVVYHLRSLKLGTCLRLKAPLPGDNPRLDSLVALWPGADMLEREIYDLFGIHFDGHPNLRRLLMPDDWEGHPLRKDYPVEGYR